MRQRVLVVDDDRRARKAVTEIIEETGAEVLTAKSGFEAIGIAHARRPDVIVLDGLLPQMHGFEVARFIRTIPGYRPIIILVTAVYKGNHYELDARVKYGIDRYLTKPVSATALLEALGASCALQEDIAVRQPDAEPAGLTLVSGVTH